METRVLEFLLKNIKTIEEQYTVAIAGKSAKNYDEYCEMCGVIKGLSFCKQEIDIVLKRFIADEDLE
jgi:predicted DNA-binding ArsR family transcriptional regulator